VAAGGSGGISADIMVSTSVQLVLRLASSTAVILVLAAAPSAAADAVLRGVTTSRGGKVPFVGVLLTLTDAEGRAVATASSGDQGRFRFPPVAAGRYRLRTQALDLIDTDREVALRAGQTTSVLVELDLLPLTESVHVVPSSVDAGTPTIEARPIPVEGLVDEAPIPTGRVEDVLALFPGIVQTTGGISIRGSWRTGQTSAQADEALLVDASTGNKPVTLPADAVSTIEALGSPFSAGLSRFSAGVTVFHTRAGSERWRILANGFIPSYRVARNNQLRPVGIDGLTPRVTVTGPLIKGRVTIAESAQYYYQSHNARDRPVDELSTQKEVRLFTRVDATLSAGHTLTVSGDAFVQRLAASNLNTFNPPGVAFSLRQTSLGMSVLDRVVFGTAGVLESGLHVASYDVRVGGDGDADMTMAPAVNSGTYFNTQARQPRSWQWTETFSRSASAHGDHVISVGLDLLHAAYRGTSASRPIDVLRVDGALAERTTFGPESAEHVASTDVALFVEDRWHLFDRAVIEAGWRVSRDGVTETTASEPRAGVALNLRRDGAGRLFGGIGMYRERTPLVVGAYAQFEPRTTTRYAADGETVVVGPVTLTPRVDGRLGVPHALTWSVGYDHRLSPRLSLSASYVDRRGRSELIVEPEFDGGGALVVSSRGTSRYRAFDTSVSYLRSANLELSASYTRSTSTADLNAYSAFVGTGRLPLVRSNGYGPTDSDVPHRVIARGRAEVRGRWLFVPVLEVRSGFPYSAVDEYRDPVGGRNTAGQFPTVVALNVSVERRVRVRDWNLWFGVRLFNVLNRFAPVDVQEVITAPDFRTMYGSTPFQYRVTMRLSR
jgi:hypothetical protein